MKQTLKKLMSAALMMICVAALTACGSAANTEEDKIDETLSMNLTMTSESLSEAIVVLSDDEIENYKESGDEFTAAAMEAWETNKGDLGEYKSMGESVVEEITDGYSVTIPAEFSKRNAEFVYTFDEQGTPTSMALNPEYTMAEKMEQALMNTLMGVGIVFLILIFLSVLISLFRFVPMWEEKMKNKGKAEETAPVKAAAPAPVAAQAAQTADDAELIAVIAAAIAAAEGTTTDGFVVRSIKKVSRKKW